MSQLLHFLFQSSLAIFCLIIPVGLLRAETPPGARSVPVQKQKQYQDEVAARERLLPLLPQGSMTALDLPYVHPPAQGSVPGSGQTLDLYVPPGPGPFPLIVFVHGGAWKGGFKERLGADLATKWLPEGFAVASIDYRFVFDSPFPGMFQDGVDAIAFLRSHADHYRLDPRKIGLMGMSAGAHIAGLVAMTEGSPVYARSGSAVQGAVILCGFYDLTKESGEWPEGKFPINPRDDFSYLYPGRIYDPAIARKMSPVYQIHPGSPPVLLIYGDKDTVAPLIQSTLFLDALRKAGTSATLTRYPGHDHDLWKPDVLKQSLAFFKHTFAGLR